MLPYKKMIEIREYHDRGGRSPFREWYDRLNSEAARKVTTAMLACTSVGSISALAIECTLGKTARGSSSCSVGERNNFYRTTSRLRSNGGKTTSSEKSNRKKRNENGFDAKF